VRLRGRRPPRENDAVREARDALVVVVAAAPVAAVVALLFGAGIGDYAGWQRWLTGSVVVAGMLLATLASALLLVDRAGARILKTRPHPVNRMPLVGISLLIGLLLVAGIPTTWPIVIGFAIVCLLLGAVIMTGALFNM
jgi:uncharacterized membrane protein (UPF0136 family)